MKTQRSSPHQELQIMNTQDPVLPWEGFQAANRFRRAIRKFKPAAIQASDIYALLTEAAYAPSSGNMQPYELHWIREPGLKANIAAACNGQKAAASAADFVVVVASPALGLRTAVAQLEHVESSSVLGQDSKAYYRKQVGMFKKILGVGSSALWSPLVALAALFRPTLSLIPVGHIGGRQWAARNAIFAAQTLMLGAAAKGIDTCPMEGFSAPQVAKLLGLPRGSVIPLVIALGYRADDARIEERWRRPMTDVVVSH
ncbi:Nadph nitroreductase protein [Pseudomonas syringae pv. tagetis]|uniref:Nadph nitroreductase protein n=2 Tax=Pseudomonas syringae pv. tagetis TaxID=129140 RepID=A0A0Q0C5W3_9PSED|nr:Nadph nitroreductase protein [Pseudomonas syringae pv. tagetis]RMW11919.1 Nadph nitroreductase protein [Pseudomonas syringae pv. tagetis]RMW24852.1 Nadph nitroreductase protein [Pseudomonas syringae pv. tagetis]